MENKMNSKVKMAIESLGNITFVENISRLKIDTVEILGGNERQIRIRAKLEDVDDFSNQDHAYDYYLVKRDKNGQ